MFTKVFRKGFSIKSKIWQTKFAIGVIAEIKELTKPPKLITASNGVLMIFAKIEYKLILLK